MQSKYSPHLVWPYFLRGVYDVLRDAQEQRDTLWLGELSTLHEGPEGLPLDELEDDVRGARTAEHDVVGRSDARMVELGGEPGLALEAAERLRVGPPDDPLDGHGAAESGVDGAVYHAESASADLFEDGVGAQLLPAR